MCVRDPLGRREWLGEGDKGIGKRMPENEQYMKKQLQTVSKWKKKMEEIRRAGDGGWEKVQNNRTHREECIEDEEKNSQTRVFQEKINV